MKANFIKNAILTLCSQLVFIFALQCVVLYSMHFETAFLLLLKYKCNMLCSVCYYHARLFTADDDVSFIKMF